MGYICEICSKVNFYNIAAYDALWAEWGSLKEASPLCATIYSDMSFRNERKGSMGEFVDSLRSI